MTESQLKAVAAKLFEGVKESMTAMKEGVQAAMPGLDMEKFKQDVGQEAVHQVKQGAHEIAAALFGGGATSGFIMYPRGGVDDQKIDHGLGNKGLENKGIEPMKLENKGMGGM